MIDPRFELTIELVRKLEEPDPDAEYFSQPKLASRTRAVVGPGTPRLADDLSERIYASYHALRRARCHGARSVVAQALNRRGIKTGSREADKEWGAEEVWDRVKRYENRLKDKFKFTGERLESARGAIVDRWIFFARIQLGAPKRGT